jgi:hypothetical protein
LAKRLLVATPKVWRDVIEVDLGGYRDNVSEVSRSRTVEFRGDEVRPVDDAGCGRNALAAYRQFRTTVVKIVEGPLGVGLSTAQPVDQQVTADRPVRCQAVFVLDDFRRVGPVRFVCVGSLEPIRFG